MDTTPEPRHRGEPRPRRGEFAGGAVGLVVVCVLIGIGALVEDASASLVERIPVAVQVAAGLVFAVGLVAARMRRRVRRTQQAHGHSWL